MKKTAITVAVSNRRLLKLAKFLRTVPPEQFDYDHWVQSGWSGNQNLSCGTRACALGWAATMPTFRRLGMRLQFRTNWYGGREGMVTLKNTDAAGCTVAEKIFGLSSVDAEYLFIPGYGERRATAKQVAKKIEQFVKNRNK